MAAAPDLRQAQVKSNDDRHDHDHSGGWAEALGCFRRNVALVLAHVHHHDQPEVIVSADNAVNRHQNRKLDQIGTDRGPEDVQFPEETSRDREPKE